MNTHVQSDSFKLSLASLVIKLFKTSIIQKIKLEKNKTYKAIVDSIDQSAFYSVFEHYLDHFIYTSVDDSFNAIFTKKDLEKILGEKDCLHYIISRHYKCEYTYCNHKEWRDITSFIKVEFIRSEHLISFQFTTKTFGLLDK